MTLRKINTLILGAFILLATVLFSYSYNLTKNYIVNENISRIKGDILELGYNLMKSIEQDGFDNVANILYRSVATHKEYFSLSIVMNENVIVSSDKKIMNTVYEKGIHLDQLSINTIDDDMRLYHEYPIFYGGNKKEIYLVIDLDRGYLSHNENEIQSIVFTFSFYGLILMFIFLVLLYYVNIKPLVKMNKNILQNDFSPMKFYVREYRYLYTSLKNKYHEIVLLNETLENKVKDRTNELSKTNQQFEEAQKIAQLGSWEWHIVNETLTWSDEIYRIFGLSKEKSESTYGNFLNAIHEDDRKLVEDAVQNSLETGDDYVVKHRIVLPDATEKIVLERGRVEVDKDKQPIRMIGTVLDITVRHKREKELKLQSELLNSVTDSILVHDLDGNILYINEATYLTRGYTKEEILSMKIQDLDYHDEKTGHEVYEANIKEIEAAMKKYSQATFEVEHKTKDGRVIPLEVTSKLITINEQTRIISIARDISERKVLSKNIELSEKKYRNLVDNSQIGIFSSKLTGEILYVNDYLTNMLRYESKEELYEQKAITKYKNPEQRAILLHELTENRYVEGMELEVLTKDNKEKIIVISAHIEGDILSGVILDITESKKAIEEVTKLSKAIEQTDDIITITDRTGMLTFINDSYLKHTGYTYEESIGQPSSMVKSGKHNKAFYKGMWSQILSGETFRSVIINRKKDGELYYEEKTITPIKNDAGYITSFVSTGKDITTRIEMQQDLERLATTDQLTGIYNRHKFEELFQHEIDRSRRYKKELSLIMLDIDYFKNVNDTYGHDAGDMVLKNVVNIVKTSIRNTDIFARWGGEEFLILCPETDMDAAEMIAQKLRRNIEVFDFDKVGKITSSFGVTLYNEEDDQDTFTKRVDEALYEAKDGGRNRVVVK